MLRTCGPAPQRVRRSRRRPEPASGWPHDPRDGRSASSSRSSGGCRGASRSARRSSPPQFELPLGPRRAVGNPPLSPGPQFHVGLAQGGGEFLDLFCELGLPLGARLPGVVSPIEALPTGLGELLEPLRNGGLGQLHSTSSLNLAHVALENAQHHSDLLVGAAKRLSPHRSPPQSAITYQCPRKSDARHTDFSYDPDGNLTTTMF